jgi:hypothetical protein
VTAPLDLDAIEARAEAATEGPWWPEGKVIGGWRIYARDREQAPDFTEVGSVREVFVGTGQHDADADFIAHARTDVPALLAEVRRLHALNADGAA